MGKLILGDKVKDKVSGFEGIAVTRTTYLQGCDRIGIQPTIDKDGKLPEYQYFDADLLEVIEAGAVKRVEAKKTGGPDKYAEKRR